MEPTYPPPTAGIIELLRDYPHAVEVGLFTSVLPVGAPVGLEDLTEASFLGYQRWNALDWDVLYQQLDPAALIVAAAPRFELQALIAPLIVRGYFVVAHLDSGVRQLVTLEPFDAPVTISKKGDVVLTTLFLTAERVSGQTVDDVLTTRAQVLVAANGGRRVKFRGNERKALRNLQKAIEAVQRRDARWPNRTQHSRLADMLILTEGSPNYLTMAESLRERCQALLALQ